MAFKKIRLYQYTITSNAINYKKNTACNLATKSNTSEIKKKPAVRN